MTSFGIYTSQNADMLNIELARILQADREREIEAGLRDRRMLRPTETTEAPRPSIRSIRPAQRPASTTAVSR